MEDVTNHKIYAAVAMPTTLSVFFIIILSLQHEDAGPRII